MKTFNIIFLLLAAIHLQAQSPTSGSSFSNQTAFKIGYYSYFGNLLINSGLSAGAEYAWKEKEKVKDGRKGQKTTRQQLLFHSNLGYSTNLTSQTDNGLSADFGMIWRRTGSRRWQLNVELNPLGYYRSILPAAYEIEGDDVSEVRFPGRNYYAPSFGFGIGRQRKNNKQAGWQLNFNYNLRMPYNAGALPTLYIQFVRRLNFKK